jgi:hypothetical protein
MPNSARPGADLVQILSAFNSFSWSLVTGGLGSKPAKKAGIAITENGTETSILRRSVAFRIKRISSAKL